MAIFELTGEQKAVQQIDNQLRIAANAMKQAYTIARQTIYQNAGLTSDQVYAAFGEFTTTGLTVEQLGQSARLIKSAINQFAPGTINDETPEATITY